VAVLEAANNRAIETCIFMAQFAPCNDYTDF
jgi:hypothetical protein